MVFSDADAAAQQPALGSGSSADGAKGWDSIGSLTERRKENVVEARPWVGETLKAGGKKNVGGSAAGAPKMAVFRDPVS